MVQPGKKLGTIIHSSRVIDVFVYDNDNIYISEHNNHRVSKLTLQENGSYSHSVVAGASNSNAGNSLGQLNRPRGIYLTLIKIYVSDQNNHRIVKWRDGASQGILVAGGNNSGNALNQLNSPMGVAVDDSGNIYVADR